MSTKAERNREAQRRLRERRKLDNRKRVSVWLDADIWAKCHALAEEEGVTVGAVLTNLLHHAYWKRERQSTIYDR